jgi:hypothetical protein
MTHVCDFLSIHWKEKLWLISLNYHPKFSQLGMNYLIGLNLHMDNLKVQQISLKITIILFITRVKLSNLSILCFTKLYNQIPEIIRPHNQATLMHYYNTLPATYHIGLKKRMLII